MSGSYDAETADDSSVRRLEVVGNDEANGKYTFVPRDADENERSTAWMTVPAYMVLNLDQYR